MRGMLVSEVSFGRLMGVLDALRLPFMQMKVGPRVYVVVEAVEGAVSSRESVAATRDGYRGYRKCARAQSEYGKSWVKVHAHG